MPTRAGLRSDEAHELHAMLAVLKEQQFVCVFVKGSEHEPWMIGQLTAAQPSAATVDDVQSAQALGFSTVREGATQVLRLTKYEPFEVGSRRFVETKVTLVVPTTALRRANLQPNNPNAIKTSAKQRGPRYGQGTFELKEGDHRAIVTIMAAEGIGEFKVEKLLGHQFVTVRGKLVDEIRVKWVGWDRGEEDLTWERLDNFADDGEVRVEAEAMAQQARVRRAAREAAIAGAAAAAREAAAAAGEDEADGKEAEADPGSARGSAADEKMSAAEEEAGPSAEKTPDETPCEMDAEQQTELAAEAAAASAAAEEAVRAADQLAEEAAADEAAAQEAERAAKQQTELAAEAAAASAAVEEAVRAAEQLAEEAAAEVTRAAAKAAHCCHFVPHEGKSCKQARADWIASRRQVTYSSAETMLELVDLAELSVVGDGNCGYYACIATRNDGSLKHPIRQRGVTPFDYNAQQTLRNACVHWWLHTAPPALCQKYDDQGDIKKHRRGKTSTHMAMGEYANDLMLHAVTAVEGVALCVVDTKSRSDLVTLYPAARGKIACAEFASWAEDVVPWLQRQHEGCLQKGERKIRVILHNGNNGASGHFDATCACPAALREGAPWASEPVLGPTADA
jgi:hypothetical protein